MLPDLRGKSVAIVGGGPTFVDYTLAIGSLGARSRVADEIWALGPVAGAVLHDRVVSLETLPLGEVIVAVKHGYIASAPAHALAAAIACGTRRVFLFGCEDEERACLEFWIGVACTKGIEVTLPLSTSLLYMNRRSDGRV